MIPPFQITLSLPPPDNRTHMHAFHNGRAMEYPTAEYKDWIELSHPLLLIELRKREIQPDTNHWWAVRLDFTFGVRFGDMTNLRKPILDLLSGRRVVKRRIEPGRGLWDDDRRVGQVTEMLKGTHYPADRTGVRVTAMHAPAPPRFKGVAGDKIITTRDQELLHV